MYGIYANMTGVSWWQMFPFIWHTYGSCGIQTGEPKRTQDLRLLCQLGWSSKCLTRVVRDYSKTPVTWVWYSYLKTPGKASNWLVYDPLPHENCNSDMYIQTNPHRGYRYRWQGHIIVTLEKKRGVSQKKNRVMPRLVCVCACVYLAALALATGCAPLPPTLPQNPSLCSCFHVF